MAKLIDALTEFPMHIEPQDRRTILKQATQDLHSEVDALASRLDLTRRNGYCQFLLATAAPMIGLELALERSDIEKLFVDWGHRRRRFALALDLHALELTAAPVDARCPLSLSEMFGVLYVIEGSRLGSQVLLRRVDQSRDEGVLSARTYLRASDPMLWVTYLRTLESTDASIDCAEMIAAARYTFGLFRSAFTEYCAPVPSHGAAFSPAFA
jgi:heme oxygenase (biliverdin-IX-beta and delta-forming)